MKKEIKDKLFDAIKGLPVNRNQKEELVKVFDSVSSNKTNVDNDTNEDSVYIINAEDGEDLGSSGSSYNLYSKLTGQLIPNDGVTLEQFKEIYGMSFIDFYNNINSIQIIYTDNNGDPSLNRFGTIIVPTDGKIHHTLNNEGQSFEVYVIKFTKTIIEGWMNELFSVNFKFMYLINNSTIMCDLKIVDYEIKR